MKPILKIDGADICTTPEELLRSPTFAHVLDLFKEDNAKQRKSYSDTKDYGYAKPEDVVSDFILACSVYDFWRKNVRIEMEDSENKKPHLDEVIQNTLAYIQNEVRQQTDKPKETPAWVLNFFQSIDMPVAEELPASIVDRMESAFAKDFLGISECMEIQLPHGKFIVDGKALVAIGAEFMGNFLFHFDGRYEELDETLSILYPEEHLRREILSEDHHLHSSYFRACTSEEFYNELETAVIDAGLNVKAFLEIQKGSDYNDGRDSCMSLDRIALNVYLFPVLKILLDKGFNFKDLC